LDDWDSFRGDSEEFPFEDFKQVKISSHFYIKIEQDDEYTVRVKGRDLDDVYLRNRGNKLEIEYKNDWTWWEDKDWGEPDKYVYITTPTLESLELLGACEGEISGFRNSNMEISMTGASDLRADIDPDFLDINLTGASILKLDGHGDRLDVKMEGASKLEADDYRADKVKVRARGASKATVFASEEMDITADGVSTVRYRGTNNVRIESEGLSTVKRN